MARANLRDKSDESGGRRYSIHSRTIAWLDQRFYPALSDSWDNAQFRQVLECFLNSESRVLDYGAGRGALPQMRLKGRVAQVTGVDPDSGVLANPYLDEAKLLPLPDGSIPYPDNYFDVVFAANVLEHIPNPVATFREVRRVLRPGGVFLAKTPNKRHYVPLIARLTPHRFHAWINAKRGREHRDTFPTLYRCNTGSDVRRVAAAAGFIVEKIEHVEGRPEYLRISAPLYALGILWERVVNAVSFFTPFRCVLMVVLRRPPA